MAGEKGEKGDKGERGDSLKYNLEFAYPAISNNEVQLNLLEGDTQVNVNNLKISTTNGLQVITKPSKNEIIIDGYTAAEGGNINISATGVISWTGSDTDTKYGHKFESLPDEENAEEASHHRANLTLFEKDNEEQKDALEINAEYPLQVKPSSDGKKMELGIYQDSYNNEFKVEDGEFSMKLNRNNMNSLNTDDSFTDLVSQVNLKADKGLTLEQSNEEFTEQGVSIKTVTISGTEDIEQKFSSVTDNFHSKISLSENGQERPLNTIEASGSVSVNTTENGDTLEISGVDTDTKFEHVWKSYYKETTSGSVQVFNDSRTSKYHRIVMFYRPVVYDEFSNPKSYIDFYI